jgi:hypothetical protein
MTWKEANAVSAGMLRACEPTSTPIPHPSLCGRGVAGARLCGGRPAGGTLTAILQTQR